MIAWAKKTTTNGTVPLKMHHCVEKDGGERLSI
jgi:hypothetical protein